MGKSSKTDKSEKSHKKHKSSHKTDKGNSKSSRIIDDDLVGNGEDEFEWTEKPTAAAASTSGDRDSVQSIPTSLSMGVTAAPSAPQRAAWMMGASNNEPKAVSQDTVSTFDPRARGADPTMRLEQAVDATDGYGQDFFGSMGTEHVRKEGKKLPDPDKAKMSRYELNAGIYDKDGFKVEHTTTGGRKPTAPAPPKPKAGSSGSTWRMAKLRRVYETAEEEQRSIDEVGLERYGTAEAFREAQEEKEILDGRSKPAIDEFGREIRKDSSAPPASKFIFTQNNSDAELSRPPSRSNSFRRPGSSATDVTKDSPGSRFATPKSGTPIPSVMTPPVRMNSKPSRNPGESAADPSSAIVLSQDELNRLQAKVLKAKLMDADSEDTKALEERYEKELARSRQAGPTQQTSDGTEVRVLPTLDGRGRLYDLGSGQKEEAPTSANQKRKRKDPHFESRDAKGEVLRYNADDDTTTMEDMVRAEKFGGGPRDQKEMDAEFASRIAGNTAFKDDLDYLDEEAERMARKKLRTNDQKKLFAIQDYAKTKKALDTCMYCYQDTDDTTVPPQVPMIALGTRCYLALGRHEGLVDGHCLIVPLQHQLTSLESDDDTWEEIKNFMKTLMQMFAEQDKGVVFYETVVNLRQQRHTVIEAVPLPWNNADDAPGYFKEGIMAAESDWSTNKRLIDFSKRPGGFRRSMVPDLPYFMVQFDYKGEKGYGHVIEGHDGVQGGADGFDVDEGEKGGGKFERFFGAETIGSMLDLEPRAWRKPKRLDTGSDKLRVKAFRKSYDKFDWTKMLAKS